MISREIGGEVVANATRFMTTLAAQLGHVLCFDPGKNRKLRKLSEERAVIDGVARIVTCTLEIQQVYEEFAQQLGQLVDFDHVAIGIIDRDTNTFEYVYHFGQIVPRDYDGSKTVLLEGTRTQKVLMAGQSLVAEDISRHPQFRSDPAFSEVGLLASIHTSLVYSGRVFGALNLRSKRVGSFGPREQAIIERLASQIAPAIRNAQLYEKSKKVENELRQSEARARALLEWAPQGIICAGKDGKIMQVNDAVLEIFGYSREELLGQPVDMLVPRDIRAGHAAHRECYFSEPETRPMGTGRDLHGLRKDGTSVPLEIRLSSIPTQDGPMAMAFISDITERKAAEEAVHSFAQVTSVMATIGRVVTSSLDINEVYDHLSQEIRKLIPFDRLIISMLDQDSESVSQEFVLGADIPGRQQGARIPLAGTLAEEVVRSKKPIMLEAGKEPDLGKRFPGLAPNFRAGMVSFLAVPLIYRDDVIGVLQLRSKEPGAYSQSHLDLAERVTNQIAGAVANSHLYVNQKDAEERSRASLVEKEALLKEINHRVKNNLQIISSLLSLQSRDIQDEQTLRLFKVSQDRIKAMALVHEKLYKSADLARIDFGEYIESLATDLGNSYGLGSRNISLKIDVENILLGVDTAIPCGVIVNELVANSLKHAFPGDRSGQITVTFREADGQYTMTFRDDGIGLPENLDIDHPSSLGLTIVNALAGQLGGAVNVGRNGGCEINITFPAKQTKGE